MGSALGARFAVHGRSNHLCRPNALEPGLTLPCSGWNRKDNGFDVVPLEKRQNVSPDICEAVVKRHQKAVRRCVEFVRTEAREACLGQRVEMLLEESGRNPFAGRHAVIAEYRKTLAQGVPARPSFAPATSS
jgi:hypothetical protein